MNSPGAQKLGWWVRVVTSKTDCDRINLFVGDVEDEMTRTYWRTWTTTDSAEFDVPGQFLTLSRIWIKGEAVPKGRNACLCIYY